MQSPRQVQRPVRVNDWGGTHFLGLSFPLDTLLGILTSQRSMTWQDLEVLTLVLICRYEESAMSLPQYLTTRCWRITSRHDVDMKHEHKSKDTFPMKLHLPITEQDRKATSLSGTP